MPRGRIRFTLPDSRVVVVLLTVDLDDTSLDRAGVYRCRAHLAGQPNNTVRARYQIEHEAPVEDRIARDLPELVRAIEAGQYDGALR